jgi:diketogulonate reductase-like aldo/keto reductase
MLTRTIPSSGQALPVIGLGTWQTFDKSPTETAPLAEVLRVLFAAGGTVIDSSPMYGAAEQVVGELLAASASNSQVFVATKVWTRGRDAGIEQMKQSMRLLRRDHIELMQIHNLVDWRTHAPVLRDWQAQAKFRYVGITHYTPSAYAELEAVMKAQQWDFVQLNYALNDRVAEQVLLPLAADRGIAVLVNQPFGGGGLLRSLLARPLPDWAGEVDCASWAQLLLKFVLARPEVSCVIPGTAKPEHMADNALAGSGAMLQPEHLSKLLQIAATI